ncbi:MAG: 30S ribosomal protein S8 [Myxococcota bacterium]
MPVTDPIGDMLTRIRNAIMARKTSVQIPASTLKERIAQVLRDEGYIRDIVREREGRGDVLTLHLKWDGPMACAIRGLRRVSRPGRRHYVARHQIPRVQSGLGVAILTTSKGVMSDRQARKSQVGGELLCEVW